MIKPTARGSGNGMSHPDTGQSRIRELESRLNALDEERKRVTDELAQLQRTLSNQSSQQRSGTVAPQTHPHVTAASPPEDKIAIFRSLFRGRDDVFPRRWQNDKSGKSGYAPVCSNEWARGICQKPKVKCSECPHQAFVPMSDEAVRRHLQGPASGAPRTTAADFTMGVYPLLQDETCRFLAADFDKRSWERDAIAFVTTCRELGISPALERSRSGSGAHVWIFFTEPVPAAEARKLGSLLITATMDRHPDIGFDSYDRLFPSQDTMPAGGFGNLIALPLQAGPRERGNSVFLDDELRSYEDQWAYLSSIKPMTRSEVSDLVSAAATSGRILGVRLPVDDDDDEPWTRRPSRWRREEPLQGPFPERVEVVLGNQVYIDRSDLPPALVNRLVRVAAFQNPEFYAAQAMRLPTYGKPRIISCAELCPKHIALPRGCLSAAPELLAEQGIKVELRDERMVGTAISTRFLGELSDEQHTAAKSLLEHDVGVLAAATAFGKTVVASFVMAARQRSTLVLVHRQQLLDQWIARLAAFLDIDPKKIGIIGAGKRKPTGVVDVALIQSLVRKGVVSDLVADYGHLIVDECHHLPAVSFEAVAREAKAKYVLGLTATVTRKDGHHPIIFMQCGPVRYRVDARKQASARPFAHKVVFRSTSFRRPHAMSEERPSIQQLYGLIADDESRNDMIFDDVLSALEAGRSPVVITERKDHVDTLAERLSRFAKNVIVLRGGMCARDRRAALQALSQTPDDEERVLVATGRYLGEGFDDARLDTLFLAMPISWRGLLAQYAGRLHRLHPAKREVVIYDYVDELEPMLAKMALKRRAGYQSLGYTEIAGQDVHSSGHQPVRPRPSAVHATPP
jgi:superfamily II DNA or RNA helicase